MNAKDGSMSWFQKWVFNTYAHSIVRHLVFQGNHQKRIEQYYSLLIDAARKEFTEDNKVTLDNFLEECHNNALNK